MKQSLELPHLRHSSLLEAKEDKKPKATAAVSGGRRHVSCLKKKKTHKTKKTPNKPTIAEILDVTVVINSKYLVLLFLKQQ